MPQTLSAKRALRRNRRQEAVNQLIRQNIKKALKDARRKPSLKLVAEAVSLLDRASKKKTIHRNKAARLKSRLAKLLPKTSVLPGKVKSANKKKQTSKK